MARRRSPWGSVRKLPSGRYQCRYRVEGIEYVAPTTFRTQREADAHLAAVRADLERELWIDPQAGRVALADYAWRWLDERPALRPRTRELYESELKLHILPMLGGTELGKLTPSTVRTWHARLLKSDGPGPTTVAKCYRLLRAILGTAVEDGLLAKNPCVIKGAGVERHEERPIATVEEVLNLADAIEPRFRAMVLLASFTSLRLGELLGLNRRCLDLDAGTVDVVKQIQELGKGGHYHGLPKSDAGRRTVAIPGALLPALRLHVSMWAGVGPDDLVFPGRQGKPLRRATFYKAWHAAVNQVGLTHLRFHDLRHTGNTLAAGTGASTKELMVRMGHSSPRAALIYQHATKQRDAAIARALSATIAETKPSLLEMADP
ncbi:MAG: site-specific integrase [Actinomycetota bacterium]|nr:site-specific integrase [Actinomycetota bacterium]